MAQRTNREYSTQEAVNSGVNPQYFGAASLQGVRAVHSNVDRSFMCTFDDGTQVRLAFLAGLCYAYRIRSIASSGATAISSGSRLVVAIR